MPVIFPYKATFSRGELSPLLHGRPDLEYFQHGLAVARNWLTLRMGGMTRRPGTYFIKGIKNQAEGAILVPFIFSSTQAYMLEFGHLYFRVYYNQDVVFSGPSQVEVVTPYTYSDLALLDFAQSGDTLFVTHPDWPVHAVTRTAHTSWHINPITWRDGPWLDVNVTDNEVTASSTGSTPTLSWTTTDGINGGAGFTNNDVGRLIRIKFTNAADDRDWWTYRITGVNTSKSVDAQRTRKGVNNNMTGSENWRLDAWNEFEGYPAHVGFYQQRLMFAATYNQPLTIWGSMSYFYDTFTPGTLDDDSVTFTLAGKQVNAISWLLEADELLIGTPTGVRTLGPGENGIFSATSWTLSPGTDYRTSEVYPVRVGGVALYAGAFGRSIREFVYASNQDNYTSPEISVLSEHLLQRGIRQLVYVGEPIPTLWATLTGGGLVCMAYDREQGITGFSPIDMAGLNVEVESIATIPGAFSDELWMIVKRTIDGSVTRYVEVMQDPFIHTTELEDAWMLDSAIFYVGPASDSFIGADHLEGEAISVWGDGAYLGEATVVGGAFDVPGGKEVANLIAGLKYKSTLTTLPFHADVSGEGDIVADQMIINQAYVDLYRSVSPMIGTNVEMYPAYRRNPLSGMGVAEPERTGQFKIDISDNWNNGGVITVEIDAPGPVLVRAIKLGLEV